jgi:hypothetical protein
VAVRDIVQFTELKSVSSPLLPLILPFPELAFSQFIEEASGRVLRLSLAQSLLEELPAQVLSYYQVNTETPVTPLISLSTTSFHDSRSTLLQLQRSLPPTNSPARLLLPGQRQRPQQIQTATTMMALSFLLVTNHLLNPPRATSTHLVHTPLRLSLTNQSPLSLSPLRSWGWSVSLRLLVLCRRFKC